MNAWTRQDTKQWIQALESRVEDITYYLDKTVKWCDDNYIIDERTILVCCFLTCIWVCQLRDEHISYSELLEILGAEQLEGSEEKLYELSPEYLLLDHEQMLSKAVKSLDDDWFEA